MFLSIRVSNSRSRPTSKYVVQKDAPPATAGMGDATVSTEAVEQTPVPQKVNYRKPQGQAGQRGTRSKAQTVTVEEADDMEDEFIVCNITLLASFIQREITNHFKCTNTCTKPNIALEKTESRLLSASIKMKCLSCKYVGDSSKLYRESESDSHRRGRRHSTLNDALGMALVASSIGATVFTQICLRLGLDPGSKSGIQNQIDRSSSQMKEINEESMRAIRTKLGNEELNISGDTMYNNRNKSNGPSQPGTQAYTTFIANNSPDKPIIWHHTANMLCTYGSKLSLKGEDAPCPNHSGCTANLPATAVIGNEGGYSSLAAKALRDEGMTVASITSDGDARTAKSFKDIFEDVEDFKDLRHISKNLEASVKKTEFSATMFPGTKKTYEYERKRFATHIRLRCDREFTTAQKIASKNAPKKETIKQRLIENLKDVPEKIIACYRGLCKENPSACSYSCPNVSTSQADDDDIFKKCGIMDMTAKDIKLVLGIINRRLGKGAIEKTYLSFNTQKNEGVNRALCKTVPKNITSPRNVYGRISAAILNVNVGFAESTKQMHSKAGHKVSRNIQKKIESHSKSLEYLKKYKAQPRVKNTRHFKRRIKFRKYDNKKNQNEDGNYCKTIDLP